MKREYAFPRVLFVVILFLVGTLVGFNIKSTSQNKKSDLKEAPKTKEVYPECFAGLCPKYFAMDVDKDHLDETVIIIPTTMAQGVGKLVIVDNGKKIFETLEMPGIWVEPSDNGDGFILKYSSPVDEDLNRKDYQIRYVYKDGMLKTKR